jgi:hypothetical protein
MATPPFVDPRRSRRARETNPVHFTISFEQLRKQHEVLAVDESLHGVRIRTDVRLCPGENVVIIPEWDSEDRILARVVWMRAVEISAGYVAGLEFAKPLEPAAALGQPGHTS